MSKKGYISNTSLADFLCGPLPPKSIQEELEAFGVPVGYVSVSKTSSPTNPVIMLRFLAKMKNSCIGVHAHLSLSPLCHPSVVKEAMYSISRELISNYKALPIKP